MLILCLPPREALDWSIMCPRVRSPWPANVHLTRDSSSLSCLSLVSWQHPLGGRGRARFPGLLEARFALGGLLLPIHPSIPGMNVSLARSSPAALEIRTAAVAWKAGGTLVGVSARLLLAPSLPTLVQNEPYPLPHPSYLREAPSRAKASPHHVRQMAASHSCLQDD